ncbi:unnamed protein product, partial [Aphanomyces euteiches]
LNLVRRPTTTTTITKHLCIPSIFTWLWKARMQRLPCQLSRRARSRLPNQWRQRRSPDGSVVT